MRIVKIIAVAAIAYAALVVVFESAIGFLQPRAGSTVVITTFDPDGTAHDRVVSRLDIGETLYVATNHWPRAWYRRALANPDVQVTLDGEKSDRRAVPVDAAEHARVETAHPLPALFRFVTGFPPRHFLRLDPR